MEHEVKKFKFVVIGGPNVGKTTLINKYINSGSVIETKPTVQLAYSNKEIIFEGSKYSLDICDTAGQERFQSVCPNFYRGAQGAIIVFDVTSYTSFQKVGEWIAEFNATMPETFQTVIAGNKNDLEQERVIQMEEALDYADKNGTSYFDISARNGDGVDMVFTNLLQKCIEQTYSQPMFAHEEVNLVKLDENNNQQSEKSSCC